MANPHAKTLQIFLPTGEPRGIRIAELTTRIVQAVLIPRSDLSTAKTRPELDHLSVYFLFGDSEEAAKPIVYVGQTEDVRKRIDSHNSNKDFWQTAILVISKTNSFTQAHIRYLEWYGIKKAQEIGRYTLNNEQIPSKPFVPEPMEADLLDAFDTLTTLLATLGYPVFEPIFKNNAAEQFFLKGKDTEAVGELVEDGFVVRAGAIARIEVVPSALDKVPAIRKKLSDSGILVMEDGQLRFTQDYLFNTPSGAATTILGRSSNGWVDWKNKDGKTLDEVKRAQDIGE